MKTNSKSIQASAGKVALTVTLTLLLTGCDFDLSSIELPFELPFDLPFMKAPVEEEVQVDDTILSLEEGQTEEEVRALLGKPSGVMTVGNKRTLLYSGEPIEFIDGKLSKSSTDIKQRIQIRERAARENLGIRFEGNEIILEGQTPFSPPQKILTTSTTETSPQTAPKESEVQGIVLRNAQGNPIDHNSLLTKGKITVVDFYATWCVPCKKMAPILDEIVSAQDDVVLKKVDIGDWGSPIANRYNVSSVPNVRVFTAAGHLVAQPTSEPKKISQYIEEARKQ